MPAGSAASRARVDRDYKKESIWNEYSALDYFWNICYVEIYYAMLSQREGLTKTGSVAPSEASDYPTTPFERFGRAIRDGLSRARGGAN